MLVPFLDHLSERLLKEMMPETLVVVTYWASDICGSVRESSRAILPRDMNSLFQQSSTGRHAQHQVSQTEIEPALICRGGRRLKSPSKEEQGLDLLIRDRTNSVLVAHQRRTQLPHERESKL